MLNFSPEEVVIGVMASFTYVTWMVKTLNNIIIIIISLSLSLILIITIQVLIVFCFRKAEPGHGRKSRINKVRLSPVCSVLSAVYSYCVL